MAETGGIAAGQLRSFVERIERLDEEQRTLGDDKRDIYAEAKGAGFDPKIIRRLVQMRRRDPAERQEEEALLDLYMHALGMTSGRDDEASEPQRRAA